MQQSQLTAKAYKDYVAILRSGLTGVHSVIEYLCADPRIARRVSRAAGSLGVAERVSVTAYVPKLIRLPGL